MAEAQISAYARIANGVVVNSILANDAFAKAEGLVLLPLGAGIGWLYDGKAFTTPATPVAPVPESVTMRQARLALSRAGVLKAANDAIEAMEGQPGEEARIEWDYAAELRRDHPLVAGLGQSLGLDDSAIDNLFREAQTL